ncbi:MULTISPECIES: tetratricopeptide repeat protein [Chryseobacterium]|uniref:tetratricopeptide repeat protein n=1 Tax=Chryseobacterium sp. R2A-55 TaxID=2744445 RepID=UPI001F2CE971|nr:tetratricopeptide repeat protein [Chryseobacterium sp. R2A-55]
MKYIILWIALQSCCVTFGQTATEYYERGTSEEAKSNFEAAIKEYSKAIEIDAAYTDAYYLRAKLYYDTNQYQSALADLDKAISLQPVPEFHLALVELRGEIYLKINDKENACRDFIQASKLGGDIDDEYLESCGYHRIKKEAVYVDLPDKKNWKIKEQSFSVEDNQYLILLINEKTEELLKLISTLDTKNNDLEQMMNNIYSNLKGKSEETKISLFEKDLHAKEPWMMYSIENMINETDNRKETQVRLLIQGENCLHSCVISVQNNVLTEKKKEELIRFFKTAKIIYR